jgi:hypothetical protein
MSEEGIHKSGESQSGARIKETSRAGNRKSSRSKTSFLYTRVVPAALVVLLIALFATLVIVGLSLVGVMPGG